MKKIFNRVLIVMLMLTFTMTSCSDDDELIQGTGVSEALWENENEAIIEGETIDFEFMAEAEWTASSSAEWCVVKTPSGVAGESLLRLTIEKNEETAARVATITLQVSGFANSVSFNVKQKEGSIEQGDGKYRTVNEWVAAYMKQNYLWNRPIDNLFLDYSINYDQFFQSILDGVSDQDEINHDDGFWEGKKRMYYYSTLKSDAPTTRVVGQEQYGSGVYLLQATRLGADFIGYAVMAVTPGTPADQIGLVRGDFITEVDGTAVTDANYKALGELIYNGNVSVTVNRVK